MVCCKQGNQGDFRLLVVESQIGNLTSNPSFGHNLCLRCPNGSCEPILNIYVPKSFQWYKELLNPIGFDPYNYFLKIWKSIVIPSPNVWAHFGVWRFIPSRSPTLLGAWDVTPMLPLGPNPFKPLLWSWANENVIHVKNRIHKTSKPTKKRFNFWMNVFWVDGIIEA